MHFLNVDVGDNSTMDIILLISIVISRSSSNGCRSDREGIRYSIIFICSGGYKLFFWGPTIVALFCSFSGEGGHGANCTGHFLILLLSPWLVWSWVSAFDITKTIRRQNRTHRSTNRGGGRSGNNFRPYWMSAICFNR